MQNINEFQPFMQAIAEQSLLLARTVEIGDKLAALRAPINSDQSKESVSIFDAIQSLSEKDSDSVREIGELERQLSELKKLEPKVRQNIDIARREYAACLVKEKQEAYTKLELAAIDGLLKLQDALLGMRNMEDLLLSQCQDHPKFKRIAVELSTIAPMPDRSHCAHNHLYASLKAHAVKIPANVEKALTH